MIIVMSRRAAEADIAGVVAFIRSRGLREHISHGDERTVIGAIGDDRVLSVREVQTLPEVEKAVRILDTWKTVSRENRAEDSRVAAKGVAFGGGETVRIAAEPSVWRNADAVFLDPFFTSANLYDTSSADEGRGRCRRLVEQTASAHGAGKPVLVRVRNVRHVEAALNAGADILYLGGGLMSDLAVLNEAGNLNIPLVLCKDKHHSAEDWLNAAEYVVSRGNRHLILGESGVLSHTKDHPYRLDVESIVKVRQISHLPVIANITGLWNRDMPQEILYGLAKAAGACGIVGTCFEKAGG